MKRLPALRAQPSAQTDSQAAGTSAMDKSRGATMVEFGIIAVALFSLIFGIIEGGFAVRARNAVSNAVDEAARSGSVAGASADADWLILNSLVQRGDVDGVDIQWVTIYNAQRGSDGADPAQCDSASTSDVCQCLNGTERPGVCNVYRDSTLEGIDGNRNAFQTGSLGASWPAASRTLGGDIGFLGVYIRADYEPIINQVFYDWSFELNASSLQSIETSGEL